MTTVTITRHHNGFENVADKLSLGDLEYQGNASVTHYTLPEGYKVDTTDNVIRDPDGIECEIVLHGGKPKLISRAGRVTAEPILTEARA
jgi:hypothetical protein